MATPPAAIRPYFSAERRGGFCDTTDLQGHPLYDAQVWIVLSGSSLSASADDSKDDLTLMGLAAAGRTL